MADLDRTAPAYAALLALLLERIGLDPTSACADNIPAALGALGIDGAALPAYVEAARRDGTTLDPLVARIVVHETWFLREPAAFEVLAAEALRAAAAGRRFRILSVPSSTGEEPYSIVLSLLRAGVPRALLEVLAFDVSPQAVRRAREGRYGALSFRGVDPAWRAAHFVPDGAHWRLVDRFEDVLRFESGNVLALPPSADAGGWDAVFCRNLLIYLDMPTRRRVYALLRASARPGSGLLFVGHAESTDAFDGALERLDHPMCFGFRNRPRPVATAASAPRPVVRPAAPARAAAPAPVAPRAPAADLLAEVRTLADRGALADAARACDRAIALLPQSAEARSMRGVLAVAMGERGLAQRMFDESLYLDPGHATSLQHLQLLATERRDDAAARRYGERLQRAQATLARGAA